VHTTWVAKSILSTSYIFEQVVFNQKRSSTRHLVCDAYHFPHKQLVTYLVLEESVVSDLLINLAPAAKSDSKSHVKVDSV